LKSELERSGKQAKEEREKILLLEGVQSAQCPLCQSDLDEEKQAALIAKLKAELEEMARSDSAMREELDREEARRGLLVERYRQMEARLKGREKLQQEIGRYEGQLKELEALQEKGGELRKRFEDLESRLINEKYSVEDRGSLQSLIAEKERLSFDPARLKECRLGLDALASASAELQRLQEAKSRQKSLQAERERIARGLAETESALEKEEFGKPVRDALEKARGEIMSLAFDSSQWEQARRQREQLADAEGRKARLAESLKELPSLEQRYRDSATALKAREESLAVLERQLEEWKPRLESLAELERDLNSALPELDKARQARDRLNVDLQKTKAELERLEKLEGEKRDLDAKTRTSHREQDLYDTLTDALGPKGVQALIIENAVPEIHQEANRILARLTGNRTHVAFESLREKKTGGLIETLDIKISDELGTRDYELYSGGEAFRTDLAIRIALSRLLARRAGTRLQTLVIDEGFGTQDAEGLESMVEAIRDIADEFEKIIVVTHLDSLKDAFPVRIEVTKSPDKGSSFTVIRN
jgi:exonuclease SbcC